MKGSKLLPVAMTLLAIAVLVIPVSAATIHVNETGWWFEGGSFNPSSTPIRSAVNNASDGDAIYIEPGHYYENIDIVNKVLSIIGNGRPADVIVEADAGDWVFYVKDTRNLSSVITSAMVSIKNMTVLGYSYPSYGICIEDFYGYQGVQNKGVLIENVTVNVNTNNGYGIDVKNSTNVMVSRANVTGYYGIKMEDDSNAIIEFSKIESPRLQYGYAVGVYSSHAMISNNELRGGIVVNSGKAVVSNNVIDNSGQEKDCIYACWGSELSITNNELRCGYCGATGCGDGIYLSGSANIAGNTITGSGEGTGIYIHGSGVTISNNIVDNFTKGLYIYYSSNVVVQNNTLTNSEYDFGVDDVSEDRLKTISVSYTYADGRPVYYFVGQTNLRIPSDASTAYCINCVNVYAEDLYLAKNIHGLLFFNCSNVVVSNVATEAGRGIDIYDCQNVSIGYSRLNFTLTEYPRGSAIFIKNSNGILIRNTSMVDKPDTGVRTGLFIDHSSYVKVMDSVLVCHSGGYVGKGFYVGYSQNVSFQNFHADVSESGIYADRYEVIDSEILGTLHAGGSNARILNDFIRNLDVSGSNILVRDCLMNHAYLGRYSNTVRFEGNSIQGGDIWGNGLEVTGKNCYMANNTITGNSKGRGIGIYSDGNSYRNNTVRNFETGIYIVASNNVLTANRIEDCKYGIRIAAKSLEDYVNHIDTSNTVNGDPILYLLNESNSAYSGNYGFVAVINCTDVNLNVNSTQPNYCGIIIAYTKDSSITAHANSSSYYGAFLDHADYNTISVSGNGESEGYGVYAKYSNGNDIEVSVSNYHDGIKFDNSNDNTLTGTITNCQNGVTFRQSDNNTVANALISNCYYGISILGYSDYNTVENSRIASNTHGLKLSSGNRNVIRGNYIQDNTYGISVGSSSANNLIYNNYFSNTRNAVAYSSNAWNVSKRSGTNLLGGNYIGGNYWSDYTGSDVDDDGFGDTPYVINANNIDYLPMVSAYHEIEILVLGTPIVNQSTLGILKVRFLNFSSGDPYEITIYDPTNAIVYHDSGTLTGDNVTIDIDWIPQATGNHTIEAYAQGTINSVTVNVYKYAVVAPIPELACITLVATGIAIVLARRRL